MAGVLTFDQYIGGPDQLIIEQTFPSNQKSVVYNFNTDVTDWTFEADYQTIIVDSIQFNRYTGQPNFTNAKVIGYFEKVDIIGAAEPSVINSVEGSVLVNFPAQMYNGPIIPDARQNVPIVVFGFTWSKPGNNGGINQIETHRWAFVQAWEPDVAMSNPTADPGYTEITI